MARASSTFETQRARKRAPVELLKKLNERGRHVEFDTAWVGQHKETKGSSGLTPDKSNNRPSQAARKETQNNTPLSLAPDIRRRSLRRNQRLAGSVAHLLNRQDMALVPAAGAVE